MSLTVRRITTHHDFRSVEPLWSRLATEGEQSGPFFSHDWFDCCWAAAPSGTAPEALIVEDGGAPVAALPLQRRRERLRGVPVRALAILDCPDTPFADIVGPGDRRLVVTAIVDHLRQRRDWDILHWQKLPATSATLKALETVLPGRLPWRRAGTVLSPYVAITGSWESFYRAKTQRFKKTARNIHNRLQRAGHVAVEEHRALRPHDRAWQDAIAVGGRSWKATAGLAIATMPRMPEFFASLTERAGRREWLSLWLLRLDERVIAMEYQLVAGGRVHALRADYDLAYRELSPGAALNFAIVRALFERGGLHEYDMGPGLNDYKLHWATGHHESVGLDLYRPSVYGRALHLVETALVPAARRARGRRP